jgi:hypothetical protein
MPVEEHKRARKGMRGRNGVPAENSLLFLMLDVSHAAHKPKFFTNQYMPQISQSTFPVKFEFYAQQHITIYGRIIRGQAVGTTHSIFSGSKETVSVEGLPETVSHIANDTQ